MTKTELLKVRVTMNSEAVNNMYKMRYDDIDVLNWEDVSLTINQLELIKDMLEGAMGKEKKEIRLNYLRECKKYFAKMINCDYTYNIKVMGRTDIDIVLRKSRIYKTDLARLYYSVKVYKMALVKYRIEELDRVEKDIEKEVEKETIKEKKIEKLHELFQNEKLDRLEKDLEKEVEKEIKKEKELEKQYQTFTNEELQNMLNEHHNLSNIIVPILRKRGLTLYQYTEDNGYEWV